MRVVGRDTRNICVFVILTFFVSFWQGFFETPCFSTSPYVVSLAISDEHIMIGCLYLNVLLLSSRKSLTLKSFSLYGFKM